MSIHHPSSSANRAGNDPSREPSHRNPNALVLVLDDCPWRRLQLESWLEEKWMDAAFEIVTITDENHIDRLEPGRRPVMLFCPKPSRQQAENWLARGVGGIVPFDLDPPLAQKAVDYVLAGGRFMPFAAGEEMPDAARPDLRFTPREEEVAGFLVEGLPNKLIAHELKISEATVKVYVRSILRKLGCHNRTRAARILSRDRAA
ncbi:MAG: response regulator transcription factor [Geminicoccaceae bacterium]